MPNNLLSLTRGCTTTELRWQNSMHAGLVFSLKENVSDNFFQKDIWKLKLNDLYKECRLNNWDEEEAEAISLKTYYLAKYVLDILFENHVHIENMAPAPDGSIGLNWTTNIYSIYIRLKETNIIYTRVENANPNYTFISSCQYWDILRILPMLRHDIYD